MPELGPAIRRYARAHRLSRFAVLLLALAACEWFLGSVVLTLPGSGQPVRVAFRRELPLIFASLAVGTLGSPLEWVEAAAPRMIIRRVTHLGMILGATVLVVLTTELLTTSPATAVVVTRALLVWFGLAVVSGRTFGWGLSWLLPMITVFPLTFFGTDSSGGPRWWNWTLAPPQSLPLAVVAAISCVLGVTAVWWTPWRSARARGAFGRTRGTR